MTPQEMLARIDKAHTKENEAKLKAEFKRHGMKLTRSGSGKSGSSITDQRGVTIAGMTLADAEDVLKKVEKGVTNA